MARTILALNAGSSSLKLKLFEADGLAPLAAGAIEAIGTAPHLLAHLPDGGLLAERRWSDAAATHEDLFAALLDMIAIAPGHDELAAIGHRVVHGGRAHRAPARVDAALLEALEALTPLAPLHQPHSLAPMRALAGLRPDLPHIACFDTAFHHTMPDVARRFAIPRAFEESGVLRYGFHGLSYEFIASRLPALSPRMAAGRVIAAHLGSGASLCALQAGRSIDTTTGFSALDGLVMGTRCGAIDPGVLLHLLGERGMSAAAIEAMLYKESGLLGVSGISADLRVLEASHDKRACEAIELFAYSIARHAGALACSLGGLDGIVFTAGVGEHSALVRKAVCRRLGWLGVTLDEDANARGTGRISAPTSAVEVWVVRTDEELMIAEHVKDVLCLKERCKSRADSDAVRGGAVPVNHESQKR